MRKVIIIIGTRPEAIKMAPLILRLKESNILEPYVLCTGQHNELVSEVLDVFGITADKWVGNNFSPKSPSSIKKFSFSTKPDNRTDGLVQLASKILGNIGPVFDEVKPDYVCVQGDTTSAMIASLTSFYMKIKFIHIEAGLRSGSLTNPYPEEYNRKVISIASDYNFCPTKESANNLKKENITKNIHVVGNTVADALFHVKNKLKLNNNNNTKMILVTSHRRENWGKPIEQICNAIKELSNKYQGYKFIYFCHPNPIVTKIVNTILNNTKVTIRNSSPYDEFLYYLCNSEIIITDSGGIQEEASILGIPTIVTREFTERPEGLNGPLKLLGSNKEKIIEDVSKLIEDDTYYKSRAISINKLDSTEGYGEGNASDKIVKILENDIMQ